MLRALVSGAVLVAAICSSAGTSRANWSFDIGNGNTGTATDSQVAAQKKEVRDCIGLKGAAVPSAGECGYYHQAVKQCGYPLPIEFTDDWIAHLIANNISVMGTITAVSTTLRDSCQYSPPDFKASLSKKVHKVSLVLDMKKIPSCPGGDLSKPSIIELRNDVLVITTGDCNTDFSEQLKTCFRNHI